MKSLVLLGVLSTVLAIENKTVRNGKPTSSKGGPKRLRRNKETTPLSDAKFGRANLIAKWVNEAKEDLEEIQELLNKALDDDNSMPPLPVPVSNPTAPPVSDPTAPPVSNPTVPPVSSPTVPPVSSQSVTPTMPPARPCGMTQVERRGQISATIATVSKVEDLNMAGSPQNMALDWLINKDAMYSCPEDENLVQRYVVAVFYYSSIGDEWLQCSAPDELENPDSIEKANANCNIEDESPDGGGTDAWLTPVSECQWAGLACQRSIGNVLVRIDFGEFVFGEHESLYELLSCPAGTHDLIYLSSLALVMSSYLHRKQQPPGNNSF